MKKRAKVCGTVLMAFIMTVVTLLLTTCSSPTQETLFRTLSPEQTGIGFVNAVTETATLNILNFHYIYNGGGVGVADFDLDGRPDLIFSGNQVPSRLYLNQGGLRFQDVTPTAGIHTQGWATGISIVDINTDGWPDIYMSIGGFDCTGGCANQLYLHQGIDEKGRPYFIEAAADYGLADQGRYTQQAAFFDYDGDGDLDVYLLHNAIDERDKNMPSDQRFISAQSKDQLLENREGQFVNVSAERGIDRPGYGLGITINDFNGDLLPDIYVANDFLSNDLLYLNLGGINGEHQGFAEVGRQKLKHTSYNAMGVDVADINNDTRPDIMVLDMLPEDNERQKTMLGFMNYNKFQLSLRQGYAPQYVRNTLQVHNGWLNGEMLPFAEVGYLSGVHATDWSWTPLLADFDNDGDRDLYVTNGYGKDITDLDFINYSQQLNPFGTKNSQDKVLYEAVQAMPSITRPNYVFENKGNLRFEKRNSSWTEERSTISNGAVYVDLDDDGDLDLVANNLNEPVLVFENQLIQQHPEQNYLKIDLKGSAQNPTAIGTVVRIWSQGRAQQHYQSPIRGYLSTVTEIVHFGLGSANQVDSILVVHPQLGTFRYRAVAANQTLLVKMENGDEPMVMDTDTAAPLFRPVFPTGLNLVHQEDMYSDFDAQPLLLRQLSQQGPCIISADLDGRPGDEIFVGGARETAGRIFTQTANGSYTVQLLDDAQVEDTAAAFADVDGDGDLDLYVVTGGTVGTDFRDRIYLNDGQGRFAQAEQWSSPANSSGACVIANDFDQDGDVDFFVGGRVVPGQYPRRPRSYLLVNYEGRFVEMTDKLIDGYDRLGMVTDAIWSDYDQDGRDDLIVVGEWMPMLVFQNKGGHFELLENETLHEQTGLWISIKAADIDGDGDEDYLLGNQGQNTRLTASKAEPLLLLNKDYDSNGSPDPFIGQSAINAQGERHHYPLHARDDVVRQVTQVKDRYVTYADFGRARFFDLFMEADRDNDFLCVNNLNSSIIENKGHGDFACFALPQAVQLAPIQDMHIDDYNTDGYPDVLLSGNDYTGEKTYGWQDAFNGLLLLGDGQGGFNTIPAAASGFYVPGDGRELCVFTDRVGEKYVLVGQNDNEMLVFQWGREHRQTSQYAD